MPYRLPAEWEPQDFVLLTWPNATTDWAPYLQDIQQTVAEMVRVIARHEDVVLVTMFRNDVPEDVREMEHVFVVELPNNDTWTRDFGPIVLKREGATSPSATANGADAKETLWLDFCFNGWGEKFLAYWDNLIPLKLWTLYGFMDECDYEDHQDFVLEGGSIDTDGRGTLFTTSQCLLAPHRNQPLGQADIDRRLREYLGASRIVWLNHGSLIGDDTDGHIDTLVRIAPDDTLLYTGADDDHPDLTKMERELQQLTTLDGRPYRLLRLPLPRPLYDDDGQRLPATYANYLVINGAVLVPTYAQPDLDSQAMQIVGQAFHDREVVGIDCRAVVRQHGSLHCCTMQYY